MFIIFLSTFDFHLHYYDQAHFDVDNDESCFEHIVDAETLAAAVMMMMMMMTLTAKMVAAITMTKMATMVFT